MCHVRHPAEENERGELTMKKTDSDDRFGLGLALGVIAGLAINNLALGVALGLISGSLTKLKNKDKK